MLKLLKYDLKRNANVSLGLLAVLVFLQILLSVVGNTKNWEQSIIIGLTFSLYMMTGIIMIIVICKTYENNIKAYSRRLLPIRPMWTAVSCIIIGWIIAPILALIALLHGVLYKNIVGVSWWQQLELTALNVKDLLLFVFLIGWGITFLMMIILLSMTIGASISLRGKAGTWVGILSFFIFSSVLSWVERQLFGAFNDMLFNVGISLPGGEVSTTVTSSAPIMTWGPLLFEAVIIALMLVVINYLISKKVEI